MIDVAKLKGLIVEKGYSQKTLANEIPISPKTFYAKMKKGIFDSSEIERMIDILEITEPMPIFFKQYVSLKATN